MSPGRLRDPSLRQPPTIESPLLSVRGVRKAFGDHVVLDDLSLDVYAQRVVVLVGAPGSGRSTLLRCIALLEDVDEGVIELEGRDLTDPRLDADVGRGRIGTVFPARPLLPHLRVLENVALGPLLSDQTPPAQAVAALERVGLAAEAQALPDELSGGQQQRAAIARALAIQPTLLLVDDVTGSLDLAAAGDVLSVLAELKQTGLTMVVVTHETDFAREVADEVCFLHGGRVHERGTPARVLDDPRRERTREFVRGLTGP